MKKIANEKQLIDVNKAFEMITDFAGQADTKSAYAAFWKAGRAIQNMNTVDAVEVIHSTWTFNKDGSGTCQNCHRITKNAWDYDSWMRYCPDCGARMDGDKYE